MTGDSGGLPRWIEAPLALAGLVVLSPLLFVLAAAVRVGSRGPVLFRQERVGLGGRPFVLLKLRTMRSGSSGPRVTARGDDRITAVGRVLRRTKLDELPELWNILKGDMSFVGPRPEVPAFVDPGDPLWRRVLGVRPGLTDPVTLRLRNEEDLLPPAGDRERFYREELRPYKLRGYVEYLDRRTVLSDIVVLVQTLLAVVVPRTAKVPSLEEIRKDRLGGTGPHPP